MLAWRVDARRGEAGFAPHRDRQPDSAPASFRADGSPKYASCWLAVTDATPETGCLYVIPRAQDPGYTQGAPLRPHAPHACTACMYGQSARLQGTRRT
jgi:ectoine hydroxylase-related dioxygenase (phytanoyl-CoA dioxygenase family)